MEAAQERSGEWSGDWSGQVVWSLVAGSGLASWSREAAWRQVDRNSLEASQGMVWKLVEQAGLKARRRKWSGGRCREVVLESRKTKSGIRPLKKINSIFSLLPRPRTV